MSRRRSSDQARGRQAPGSIRSAQQATPGPTSGMTDPRRRMPPSAPDPVYRALLPLRFFLGGMFLYAGLDKLVDPAFLAATGPGSVGEQLAAFTHVSPLTPLIETLAQPWPVAVGLGMALFEIAVGLGALTGIVYRASAAVGAGLSLLFLLTASWDTRPIYYGPDLPYMVGWITLALAGSGGLYVLEGRLLERLREAPLPAAVRDDGTPASAGRRALLEVGVLGFAALAVAVAGRAFGRLLGPVFTQEDAATAAPSPAAASSPGPSGPSAPAATAGAASAARGGIANATTMPARSSVDFMLANGDPGVVVKLADGKVVAYDATCTHEGCPVGYDAASGLLLCPCHGAAFDPAAEAVVVNGPARRPLASVPISIDPATGAVTVSA
jgi:thiosulfate dehydrogenase (quinone) large subunit